MFLTTHLLCAAFAAQSLPASQPATQPGILAGPAVHETQDAQPSIVNRSFDGALEDVGPEPDVAAVAALDLTDEQRRIFDEILSQRYADFDRAVRANYALLVELGAALNAQDQDKSLDLLNKTRFAFADFFRRGSFVDQMQEHLTDQQREQLNIMLNDYRIARIEQMQRMHGVPRQQAAFRARIEAFGQMVRQSIERQVSLDREQFERLALELNLTEEQNAKSQAIFGPLAVKRLQDQATAADRAEALREFNRMLTPQQRMKALGLLIRQWSPTEPSAPASQPASQPR